MFVVLGIVLYRTHRGLPLRRRSRGGRCCARRNQPEQSEEACEVVQPLLDDKAGLPEYSEVVKQEEARYVKINGKMVQAATVVPRDDQFPPPLTADDEWDDTNVESIGAVVSKNGELVVCWVRYAELIGS